LISSLNFNFFLSLSPFIRANIATALPAMSPTAVR
jgi:hypothetical protein